MGLQRKQVVIAALAISGALAYLVFTGMRDTMVFYYTVSEVVSQSDELSGSALRVAGHVVPGTIEVSNVDHLDRRFVIHEGGRELQVEYRGIVADTLVDNAEAVVEGQLGDDGVFHATFVMAKCPSKYESDLDPASYPAAGVDLPVDTNP